MAPGGRGGKAAAAATTATASKAPAINPASDRKIRKVQKKKQNSNSEIMPGWIFNRDEGIYCCCQCKYTSKSRLKMVNHDQRVHDEEKYKCDICNTPFNRRDRMLKHRTTKHPDAPKIEPKFKPKRILASSRPPRPPKSPTPPPAVEEMTLHKCDQCRAQFSAVEYLEQHRDRVHSHLSSPATPVIYHTCEFCQEKRRKAFFTTKKGLQLHQQRHHSYPFPITSGTIVSTAVKYSVYRCVNERCRKKFLSLEALATHNCTHLEVPPTTNCDVCGECFQDDQSLNEHRQTVHSEDNSTFRCSVPSCRKVFKSNEYLAAHFRAVHWDWEPLRIPDKPGRSGDTIGIERKSGDQGIGGIQIEKQEPFDEEEEKQDSKQQSRLMDIQTEVKQEPVTDDWPF